jgi:formylglycine-generating enzyme required for sulfatase activity
MSKPPSYLDKEELKIYEQLSEFQKDYARRTGLEAVKTIYIQETTRIPDVASAYYLTVHSKIPMRFVLVPPSTSPEHQKYYGRKDFDFGRLIKSEFIGGDYNKSVKLTEKLGKKVAIKRPFYLGATEVTRRQWKVLMGTDPVLRTYEKEVLVDNKNIIEGFMGGILMEMKVFERLKKHTDEFPLQVLFNEAYDWLLKDKQKSKLSENYDELYKLVPAEEENSVNHKARALVLKERFPAIAALSLEEFDKLEAISGKYIRIYYDLHTRFERPERGSLDTLGLLGPLYYLNLLWEQSREVPVASISYQQVQENKSSYVNILSHTTGTKISLPTAEEWEYACRGGSVAQPLLTSGKTKKDSTKYDWKYPSFDRAVYPAQDAQVEPLYKEVAQMPPNPWGFYDIIGNVSEFCIGNKNNACYKPGEGNGFSTIGYNIPIKKTEPSGSVGFRLKLFIDDEKFKK